MSSEKFCLRWNDFESNISVAFRELRDDNDFFDVTLACDDEQIQAHKMILSACSPFFRTIFRRNPHQHPLLYFKGVKYSDLQSVLNFMYHGEVNVAQEELNSFLSVAEDLQVKGLTQGQAETPTQKTADKYSQPKPGIHPEVKEQPPYQDPLPPPKRPRPAATSLPSFPSLSQGMEDEVQEVAPVKTEPRESPTPTPAPALLPPAQDIYKAAGSHSLAPVGDDSYLYQDDQYDGYEHYEDGQQYDAGGQGEFAPTEGHKGQSIQDPSDLLQFVRRDQADKKFYCTLCENFSHIVKTHARNHVESKHYPNAFSYSCDQCEETFTTKTNLNAHRTRKHKQLKTQQYYVT